MEHYSVMGGGCFCYGNLYKEYIARAEDGWKSLEIGGCWGLSTAFMGVEIINSGKKLTHYVVDAWIANAFAGTKEGLYYGLTLENLQQPSEFYNSFLRAIEPVKEVIVPIRNLSVLAAADFPDDSLNLIFIDGSHDYDSCKEDILAWWPKLKIGGEMAGDDYVNFAGVQNAVKEIFGDINPQGICAWRTIKESKDIVRK